MRIRITRKGTGEKFNTVEHATRAGFNGIFDLYEPFTKSEWDNATENGMVNFTADEEDFGIISKIYTLETSGAQQQPEAQKINNAATAAQINYLDILRVRIENEMSKSRASQLIDAAKNDELGSVGGYYTDGSN